MIGGSVVSRDFESSLSTIEPRGVDSTIYLRIFFIALTSICRTLSRLTPTFLPTSSNVKCFSTPIPYRNFKTVLSRGERRIFITLKRFLLSSRYSAQSFGLKESTSSILSAKLLPSFDAIVSILLILFALKIIRALFARYYAFSPSQFILRTEQTSKGVGTRPYCFSNMTLALFQFLGKSAAFEGV